jgi:hypothetical protein
MELIFLENNKSVLLVCHYGVIWDFRHFKDIYFGTDSHVYWKNFLIHADIFMFYEQIKGMF